MYYNYRNGITLLRISVDPLLTHDIAPYRNEIQGIHETAALVDCGFPLTFSVKSFNAYFGGFGNKISLLSYLSVQFIF